MTEMTQAEREEHKAEKRAGGTWGCRCEDCQEEIAEGRMVSAADLRAVIAFAEDRGLGEVSMTPEVVREARRLARGKGKAA